MNRVERHTARKKQALSPILAATVVGVGSDAVTVPVSHETELDSGSVVHHGVIGTTDRKRINALKWTGLTL
jgi:hypothetical protein